MDYICNACNYTTNVHCNYIKHIKTSKHFKKNKDNVNVAINTDKTNIINRINILEQDNLAIKQQNKELLELNKDLREDINEIQEHIDNLINRYSSVCIMLKDMRDNKTLLFYNIVEYDKEQDVTEQYNKKLIKYMCTRAELRKQKLLNK